MRFGERLYEWMVDNLEQPLLEAELHKVEMARDHNPHDNANRIFIAVAFVTAPLLVLARFILT